MKSKPIEDTQKSQKTTAEHLQKFVSGPMTMGLVRVAQRVSLGDITALADTPGFRKAT